MRSAAFMTFVQRLFHLRRVGGHFESPRYLLKWLRLMMNVPIWLFHMRLGWLAGDRFLLLTHTGRKSGLYPHILTPLLPFSIMPLVTVEM
jgi:hypothetical protein